MCFLTHNRGPLRGLLVGAVVLASLSACSRSDRADRGSDTTSVNETGVAVQSDTQATAKAQPSTTDTVSTSAEKQETSTAAKPSPTPAKPSTPRGNAEPSSPSVEDSTGETSDYAVSGYRAMGHDTTQVATDTSSSTTDTSVAVSDTTSTEMAGAAVDSAATEQSADTTATGYAQVTPDTTASAAQSDTTPPAEEDVAIQAQIDTSAQVEGDNSGAQAHAAAQDADTAVVVGDSAEVGKDGDRLNPSVATADTVANDSESERVRPPEDSTETLGQITTDEVKNAGNAENRETVSNEADTQPTGAARTTEMATGADAVALMSRQGLRCTVIDSDSTARQSDMASTPATLNPCGLGTMQLSRIWTGEEK